MINYNLNYDTNSPTKPTQNLLPVVYGSAQKVSFIFFFEKKKQFRSSATPERDFCLFFSSGDTFLRKKNNFLLLKKNENKSLEKLYSCTLRI